MCEGVRGHCVREGGCVGWGRGTVRGGSVCWGVRG